MGPEEITNKQFALATVAIELLCLFLALFTGNLLFIVLCLALAAVSLFMIKYGYMVIPLITSRLKIVEVRDKYEVPPTQDVVIKRVGSRYYASAFLQARVSESVTDKPETARTTMELFEKAITSVRYVVKFCALIHNIDLEKYVDRIKAARSRAETKKSQLASAPPSPNTLADVARLEREVAMYTSQLERVSGGERPVSVVCYLMTTASSPNREEAVEKAKHQANEMRTVVGSALDVDVIPLVGDDMKKCFEWEFVLPSEREMHDLRF